MKEFEKHVINERESNIQQKRISYCGKEVPGQWVFQNAEHMLNNYEAFGRLLPCPKCKKKILSLMGENKNRLTGVSADNKDQD